MHRVWSRSQRCCCSSCFEFGHKSLQVIKSTIAIHVHKRQKDKKTKRQKDEKTKRRKDEKQKARCVHAVCLPVSDGQASCQFGFVTVNFFTFYRWAKQWRRFVVCSKVSVLLLFVCCLLCCFCCWRCHQSSRSCVVGLLRVVSCPALEKTRAAPPSCLVLPVPQSLRNKQHLRT